MQCTKCESHKVIKNGKYYSTNGLERQKYKCVECGNNFMEELVTNETHDKRFIPEKVLTGKRFVVTSIQNNTKVNQAFYQTLLNYCETNDAELLIIPTLHQQAIYGDDLGWNIDAELLFNKVSLNEKISILSNIKITQSAENPLGGLESLSKGKSLIVPHNQLQMKSLPVPRHSDPIIMITSGTISVPNYMVSKAGEKAEFNHSYSAVLVDFDDDIYHIRVLNADKQGGFYDINGYYLGNKVTEISHVEALITGDEHIIVTSPEVSRATYLDSDSIVNVLKPKYIVRHDVLDCFTVSHHHRKDNFLQYSKYVNKMNKIEEELNFTLDYIEETTPNYSRNVLVSSNHHDHLKRWLNETDPKFEPWNAKIYHMLTWLMLDEIEKSNGISSPDPFKLYSDKNYPNLIKFIDRNESFKVKDIELANHGDIGANGSRGSLMQFSKFSDKMVIGHSHTPGINKGAYSVGCSTPKTLEYTNGPSSWMNTHCVIYPNGKRQLINIIKGRWK